MNFLVYGKGLIGFRISSYGLLYASVCTFGLRCLVLSLHTPRFTLRDEFITFPCRSCNSVHEPWAENISMVVARFYFHSKDGRLSAA